MKGYFFRLATGLLAPLFLAAPLAAQQVAEIRPADIYAFTQDYEPSPALWEISDEDTTIYMLGTIHALPRGFRWRSARLEAIIEEAEMLVVETSEFDPARDVVDVDAKLTARIANRLPTSARLSDQARARWTSLIAMSGYDFATIDTMPILLGMLTMAMNSGPLEISSVDDGVETVLEREFLRRDRPIMAIEDSGEVMYSLFRLDSPSLVAELDARLIAWDGKNPGAFYDVDYMEQTGNAFWEAEHRWAQGVVAQDFSIGFGDGPIGRAFDHNLLGRRNSAWAQWVETRLREPGTILLAVGAGHFEGPASLLVKLEERGLEAERID